MIRYIILIFLLLCSFGCTDNCEHPYYEHCLEYETTQVVVPQQVNPGGISIGGGLGVRYVHKCVKSEVRVKSHCTQFMIMSADRVNKIKE